MINNSQNTNSAAKLMNRKNSYERMMQVDSSLYKLYKHQNGKIEITNRQNANSIKIRSGAYSNVGGGGNNSVVGTGNSISVISGSGVNELDV